MEYDRYMYMDTEEVDELDRIDRYHRKHNRWPDEEYDEMEVVEDEY